MGPVFEPSALGLATELVAMEVAPDHADAVATAVSTHSEITHCYLHDHRINLWFAGVASNEDWFARIAQELRTLPGVKGLWRLPTLRRFKIQVHFDLCRAGISEGIPAAVPVSESVPYVALTPQLVAALQQDLPLCSEPFAALANESGLPEARPPRRPSELPRRRPPPPLRRPRQPPPPRLHSQHDARDPRARSSGRRDRDPPKRLPEVSHCYQRPTFDGFPYNLYAMVHAQDRPQADATARALTEAKEVEDWTTLFSAKEYRKSSPDYDALVSALPGTGSTVPSGRACPPVSSQSERLFASAQSLLPGGVNSPVRAFRSVGGTPRFIVRGAGARVWDADGNEYLDCVGSWGPLILGTCPRGSDRSRLRGPRDGTTFGAPTEREVELARALVEALPSLEMVRLVSSGTEAVMSALRLARAYTGRTRVIKFEGGYHGHSDGLLARAGSGLATLGLADCPGVPEAWAAETVVLPYNDLAAVEAALGARGGEIACVIVEPVAGNMGVVPPEDGYLAGLRRLTRQSGSLLIFDEVITGFRVAYGGAQTRYGITPDLTVLGKIIGGGFPSRPSAARGRSWNGLPPSAPSTRPAPSRATPSPAPPASPPSACFSTKTPILAWRGWPRLWPPASRPPRRRPAFPSPSTVSAPCSPLSSQKVR